MSDLIKAITYDYPEKIPISIGTLPALWKKYPVEMREITARFKDLFGNLSETYDYDKNTPVKYHIGKYVDEWNCVWENISEGSESYVTGHPLPSLENIREYKIPENRDGRLPHGFMYLRITDLMGFENAMIEFAYETEEIQILIDKIVEYNCYQVEAVIDKVGEMMGFGDDLGMQRGLAIGAEKWRKYLKPAFTKIYALPKQRGKLVYMHTDGCIYEIMDDLVDCGVNMINPQFRANGIDNLERICKGRIPIMLDLDRQLFPVVSPSQAYDHVRECVERLYLPQGGLGLSLELGPDVPLDNIESLLLAMRDFRNYRG
jgi:hypothetical protein